MRWTLSIVRLGYPKVIRELFWSDPAPSLNHWNSVGKGWAGGMSSKLTSNPSSPSTNLNGALRFSSGGSPAGGCNSQVIRVFTVWGWIFPLQRSCAGIINHVKREGI